MIFVSLQIERLDSVEGTQSNQMEMQPLTRENRGSVNSDLDPGTERSRSHSRQNSLDLPSRSNGRSGILNDISNTCRYVCLGIFFSLFNFYEKLTTHYKGRFSSVGCSSACTSF